MGLSHLSFLRDWKNPADFPTVEPDEATVRADLQYHPDAIKNYINETLIPSHDSLTSAKHSHDNKTILDGITANDVAKWRESIGTFRVNVTYSNGAYSADRTFAEIKAAYDAGQLPYVVLTGGTLDFIYTLAYFSVPDGTGQDFVDFARYRIEEDTLETEMLRIYSYTTDSGSNIVKRTEEFNVPNGTTYIAVDSTNDVISTVNGETYADIQALINTGKPVVVRFDDDLDFYYFETFGFSDSSGIHRRLNFRCVMGSIVYTLTLRDDNTWVISETSLQSESITDTGGYFTTDTVEGALQEIGAEIQKRMPRVFYFENDTVDNTTQFMSAEDSAALKAALINHTPVMLIAKTQGQQYCYLPVNCSPVPTSDNINDPNTEFSYTFQTVNNVYRAYVSCSGSGTPSIAVFQIIS